ncbi:unnamed protein product [Prorocentrum cordatum]|uniref:DUF8003 domain-containing protein n=1 Tax=Prorocentrum cordatum TaxID=2364126 RepID=A0ABN9SXF6_9DINO|nr:unnamed protein product [Polarella glacialis]
MKRAGPRECCVPVLVLACGLVSTSAGWPMRRSWCDSTENGICVITTNRTVSRPFQLRHKGDVEFRGAQWQCVISKGSYESLHIDIAVDGKLSLRKGSLLHCATIVLEAVKIELSDSSEVSANGTAFGSEPAIEKDPLGWSGVRRGASHGGLGGSGPGCASDDTLLLRRLSLAYGSLLAPWSMGRAGVAAARGLGGGRVRVAAQELTLNGTVSAAGVGPENIGDDEERDDTAAGSGGSIWITCRSLVQLTSQGNATSNTTPPILLRSGSGRIVATGGSCAGCLCGGGGRVVTEFAHGTAPRHVLVSGGCWRSTTALAHESTVYHHAAPLSECACGSAGTWVLRKQSGSRRSRSPGLPSARGLPRGLQHRKILKSQGQSEGDTVFVDNSHAVSLAGSKLSQPTPLAMNFGRPVALQLHDAVVVPSEERPQWNLTSLRLVSETIGSILRHLAPSPLVLKFAKPNEGVELALSSILQANELQITGAQEVVLQQNAAIDAAVASISAREVIDTHRGALGQGGGVFGLHARRVVLGGGRLRRAWISAREALTVKRGSRLLTSHRRCDQLRAPPQDPCERQLKSRSWTPGEAAPLLGNQSGLQNVTFDIVLVATNGSITVEGDAEVHAAALLLCATANLTVGGLVSARGLGCPPNRGESAGAAPEVSEHGRRDPLCGGGGGAHCGHGGDGVQSGAPHAPCLGTGGQKYDGWWSREQRGGAGELLQLAGCRPGQEGIFCAECAPGFFNPEKEPNGTEAVYRVCVPCTNKPAHANYTAKGWLNESCPYVCPGGYPPVEVNPNCDDPWTYYFAFFGGIRGASVFTISMISFFGLSVSASRVRRRKRLQWLRKHQQGSHQFHGLADEMLLLFESVRGPHPLADMHRWSQERSHYRPERSLTGRFGFIERWVRPLLPTLMRRTHSQTHLLSVGDLPYHIGRIYLLGENSPKDPWRLCRQPPDALKHLIDPARWEAFAAHVTERCQHKIRSQKVVEGVLSCGGG